MRRYGTDTLLGVDDYSKAGGISSGYYAAVFVKNGVEYIQSAKGTLGSGAYQIELDLTKAPFDTDGNYSSVSCNYKWNGRSYCIKIN